MKPARERHDYWPPLAGLQIFPPPKAPIEPKRSQLGRSTALSTQCGRQEDGASRGGGAGSTHLSEEKIGQCVRIRDE